MKDFFLRNKTFILIVALTLGIFAGGIYLFTKTPTKKTAGVDNTILSPEGSHKTGHGSVALVEFGDYQCPACGVYSPLVKELLTEFDGKMTFVFRNFPLPQHQNAKVSSNAAEAAGLQGKFWEMHDKIYETQSEWSTSENAKDIFIGYAKSLGLNVEQFKKDIDSDAVRKIVEKDTADATLLNVNSTPTFYINQVKIALPGTYKEFKTLIEDAIKNQEITSTETEKYHTHFDLKVYVNGSPIDFTLPKYQSTETQELNPDIHFHDGNGKVVHIHKKGATLRQLFDSFKLSIPSGALAYVNGKKVENILSYAPQDLDRILIGSSNINLVSNDACIYSEKCPERGTPPPENCVGGLGTDCD